MSFDLDSDYQNTKTERSQSLSIRAMSFDERHDLHVHYRRVSIPFDQGDVFRHVSAAINEADEIVSIPFDQGDVFRQTQSLRLEAIKDVSIPFDQGDVFRRSR